ncbi:PIN domain-containing protein [Clostridium perfringens]
MKFIDTVKQRISSFLIFKSTINQTVNVSENKKIISYLLEKEFMKIDDYLEENKIKEAELILEKIFLKKEALTDSEELKILQYKSLISLLSKEFEKINIYIQEMEKFQEFEPYRDTVLLNVAIHKKDIKLLNELKNNWENRSVEKISIIQNEMTFWLHIKNYTKVIEIFNSNKEVIDNYEDILVIVGQAYINLGLNEYAVQTFEKCDRELDRIKLWIEIASFRSAFNKYDTIDEFKDKEDINKFITNFSNIEKVNLSFYEEINLVLAHARATFIWDFTKCESLILDLKKIYNFIELDILYLDVLEQSNKFEEAEIIFENIIKNEQEVNIELIARGILIKYNLEKYNEVKELYEKYIDFSESMSEITYYYGIALIKLVGIDEAKTRISTKILDNNEFNLLLLSELFLEDEDIREKYLTKLKNKISKTSYFNIYIADIYYRLDMLKEAFEILLEGSRVNKIFFKRLLPLASKKDINSRENREVMRIYNECYRKEEDGYICGYIYGMLVEGKRYIQAQNLAQKMYEAKKSLFWANNYLEMKLANEELDDIHDLIRNVQSSNEGRYIINAALGYMKLGSYHLCQELCFKAYSKMKDDEKIILLKIGMIGLEIGQILNEDKKNELEREIIVTLGDISGGVKRYCITNENFFFHNSKIQKDIMICGFKDDIFIEVLGKKKGDKIINCGEEFTIIEKIDKYTYMFRQAIAYLLEQKEFNTKKITIQEENGEINIQALIDEMELLENTQKKAVEMYLKGEIPFFYLCGEREKVPEWVERLSLREEYGVMSGVNNNLIAKGDSITLSLSSIFILYFKGILDYYLQKFNVLVGNNLIKELSNRIDNLTKTLMLKNSTIFLVDGKLSMYEQTLEEKKDIIKMYKKIVECLEKATVVNVNLIENELLLSGEGFIPISDIECIEIAREYKATLILEDYILSKLACSLGTNIKLDSIANVTISMILSGDNIAKNIEVLKLLIKERYRFVFCNETLKRFVCYFELTDKWRIKRFEEIIDLLLEYDFDRFYALQLLEVSHKIIEDNLNDVKARLIRDSIWRKYLPMLMDKQ